jgi:chromosome segregation ATPase
MICQAATNPTDTRCAYMSKPRSGTWATAARWEERGDADWAEFERRCGTLEGDLAQLEADRANLERLRDTWIEQPSEAVGADIRRGSAEISRRSEQLKARDVELEEERTRLRDERERDRRSTPAWRPHVKPSRRASESAAWEEATIQREIAASERQHGDDTEPTGSEPASESPPDEDQVPCSRWPG